MNRHLHIISSKVPWPADNSIAIDTFYKIKELHKEGVKIHLHYFCNELGCHPTELNQYCESIHTYKSDSDISENTFAELINNLDKDNYPLLLESLHCKKLLSHISNRIVVVRMNKSSIDKDEKNTGNFITKFFNRKLNKDNEQLPANCRYIFTSEEDANYFRSKNNFPAINYLPVFTSTHSVTSEAGVGNFCLYQGDLSDSSNKKAAVWLTSKVFNDINTPLVIAGKSPGRQIIKLAELFSHICLISNPSTGEMDELIKKAHINILPSFSNSKPEFKLIHALQTGKHCITNEDAVAGTVFSDACHVGKNAAALKSIILQLYRRPFEEEEIELRKRIFKAMNKEKPVNTLLRWLYG